MKKEFYDIPVPKELDLVVEDKLNQIYKETCKRKMRKWVMGAGTTAAILAGSTVFCITNPALAARLPIIGAIFEMLQDDYGYSGDYNEVKKVLDETTEIKSEGDNTGVPEEKETQQETAAMKYTQTSDGLTISLSEIYCNDQALYLTIQLSSERSFENTDERVQIITNDVYSFNPTSCLNYSYLDGKYVDENTYAGILRLDLNSKTTDTSLYEEERDKALAEGLEWDDNFSLYEENPHAYLIRTVEIPESFTLDLDLSEVSFYYKNPNPPEFGKSSEEIAAMDDQEYGEFMRQWYEEHPDWEDCYKDTYRGEWNFHVDVTKNTQDTQVIELNDVNEQGIGFEKIVKDRFEITMYDIYTGDNSSADYFPVMLDADGALMPYGGGGSVNTVAIQGRDVSKVDIFLIDYLTWMDGGYKGDTYRIKGAEINGKPYREALMDICAYHKEVVLEE